jgi:hypothetical protein
LALFTVVVSLPYLRFSCCFATGLAARCMAIFVPSVSVKSAQRLWLSVERAIGIRTYFRFHCFSPKKVSPRRVAVLLSRQYTALTHWV